MSVDIPCAWGHSGSLWKINDKNKNEIKHLKDGCNSIYSVDTLDSNTFEKITFQVQIKERCNVMYIGIINNVQRKNTRFCQKNIGNNNEMKIEENRYYCIDAKSGNKQSHVTNHTPEEYMDDSIDDGDILTFIIDFKSESISIGKNDDEILPMFKNIKDLKNNNWRLAVAAHYKDNCVELLSCKGTMVCAEDELEAEAPMNQECKLEESLIEKEASAEIKKRESEKISQLENTLQDLRNKHDTTMKENENLIKQISNYQLNEKYNNELISELEKELNRLEKEFAKYKQENKQLKLNKENKENGNDNNNNNNNNGLVVDDDDNWNENKNVQKLTMSDALVLILCISAYEGDDMNLPSAKMDMELMQALWKDKYHFSVKTNDKKMNEYRFTKNDWLNLVDETRLTLRKNNHDGLIFIYSGHGYQDGILTSSNEKISFKSIKEAFNAKQIPQLKDKPKVFIVDACRCLNPKLPMNRRYFNDEYELECESECKLNNKDIKCGKNIQETFRFYHPDANVLEIYGNTSGFAALGDVEGGGSLIGPISEYFNVDDKVLKKKTFQQLLNPVKRAVHRTSEGNQNVEINDTILGYELYLGVNSGNKQR